VSGTTSELKNRSDGLQIKVVALESSVHQLNVDVNGLKGKMDRLDGSIRDGLSDIRKELTSQARPNWGWIIAACGVIIGLVSIIGAAWVRPLQISDEQVSYRLDKLEDSAKSTRDMAIRLDERMHIQGIK